MSTWKIIAIAILAITAVALTTASVFACMGLLGYNTPYTTSSGNYVTYPPGTASYGGYYGGMMGGGMGCGGMRARFGYGAPVYINPTAATQLNITTAASIAQKYL